MPPMTQATNTTAAGSRRGKVPGTNKRWRENQEVVGAVEAAVGAAAVGSATTGAADEAAASVLDVETGAKIELAGDALACGATAGAAAGEEASGVAGAAGAADLDWAASE